MKLLAFVFEQPSYMKTDASNAVFYIAKVNTIDDVKVGKTKYLVYFIAIRSSVSKLLEEKFDY